MKFRSFCCLAPAFAVALCLSGCTSGEGDYRTPDVNEALDTAEHAHHHHHAHGPHGGEIVELGSEDLHAEAVVDEDGNVLDIYILGSDAETAVSIDAAALTVSFKHGEESEDFELKAAPQDGDEEGKASRFTIASEDLVMEMHHHPEGASLMFEADGIAYMGTVVHHHGHAHGTDDGHEHGAEDGHEHGDDDADHAHKEGDGDAGHKDGEDGDSDSPETTDDAATADSAGDAEAAPADSSDEPAADEAE